MSFTVTILGSASAKPTPGRHPSAQVVNLHEQHYLVDAGEGTQQQLFRYGINPLRLRAVFLSHLHGDHCFGLFPLLSTLGLYGRRTPLPVYAPAPFGEILACHLRYFDSELPYAAAERKIARERGHSTTAEAARAALRAGAGRLVIGHFSSRYKELAPLLDEARTLFPASDLAEEGRTFTIEKRPFRC